MKNSDIKTSRVFEIFEEICKIPHGSRNMKEISGFCVEFAKANDLRYIKDEALNVIIYKDGTGELKNAKPVILQGHIDMVCQKADGSDIDFEKDAITTYIDGDYIKAKDTTLGADNGIAVAMIMAILEDDALVHPPIEAVFTTDEEIGMIGAGKLDMSLLKSDRMINLDAENDEELTVSCAGGCDVKFMAPFKREKKTGTKAIIKISNLKGGHSGVEIDKGRVNANILMSRILSNIALNTDFNIISLDGGTKGNVITTSSTAQILVNDYDKFYDLTDKYIKIVTEEISDREDCVITIEKGESGSFEVLCVDDTKKIVHILLATPNGVVEMSKTIDGLVETSLNLGIVETKQDEIVFLYTLRSNKASSLEFLKDKLLSISKYLNIKYEASGQYSPWEYKEESELRERYLGVCDKIPGKDVRIVAVHAGLECAVFSAKIKNLDCIAIGPSMSGVHTVEEKLCISSTKKMYEILCRLLAELK